LPSPRTIQIQHTRAVRRGAAWPPAERPSSCLAVREAVSRYQVASRRACTGCRALQAPSTGTLWASQRAVARRGGPRRSGCRPCLRHPVRVLGQRLASSVRCERPVSTRACPRVRGVRCPVRASERPGVHCPSSASGVRCPCVAASAVSDGNELAGVAVGPAAARLGWPGSAWSPAVCTTARRLPEVGAWHSKLAQAVLGQRRVDLGLVVVVGGA
jgi:hypothetical protein